MKVSYSEAASFRGCRQRWYFDYVMGLEPIKPAWALVTGIGVHAGLETYYEPLAPDAPVSMNYEERKAAALQACYDSITQSTEELTGEWDQQIEDTHKLTAGMLEHYMSWAPDHDMEYTIIATERYVRVPIRNEKGNVTQGRFVGKIDMLVQTDDGRLWVWENKTAGQFYNEFEMDISDQVTRYAWAAEQEYGKPIAGIVYNILKKTLPGVPDVLKSGRLSRAQSIACTAEQYTQAVLELGQDPDDEYYADFIQLLRTRSDDPIVQRHRTYRTTAEIENMATQIRDEYFDMREARRTGRVYRTTGRDCSWCPHVELCKATWSNEDTEWLIRSEYK